MHQWVWLLFLAERWIAAYREEILFTLAVGAVVLAGVLAWRYDDE